MRRIPQALEPDVCITAAYGNVLPEAFLSIPKRGTVNIHPSLLPAYRGAAPVQRALEAGERVTGVTVAFTVRAMARAQSPLLLQFTGRSDARCDTSQSGLVPIALRGEEPNHRTRAR